jgi:transposase InsO family protein
MRIHRNAKTTPAARAAIVRRTLEEGWSNAATAAAFAVSARTVAKWVQRDRAGGRAARADRSSRPGPAPHQTPARVVTRIKQLRVQHGLPAWAMAHAVGRPRSTVSAWRRRLGLSRPPAVPKVPVRRYAWAQPGDWLHVDIKPLARIRAVGHRMHGARRRTSRGAGWEYVHVAIDDHSRGAYVAGRADQTGATCAACLTRRVAWFAARALAVRRVMSDNGSGYVSRRFRAACPELSLRHLRTRPYTPRTNGTAERFIQTLLREWAYTVPYPSSQRRTRQLASFLRYDNRRRPHASLDYHAPWSRLPSAP